MRRTFLPRYGAEARKFAKSNYKPFSNGGEQIAKQLQMSCRQWQQTPSEQQQQQVRVGSGSLSSTSLSRSKSLGAKNARPVTNALLKNHSAPSNLHVVSSYQTNSRSLLGGLVAAARRGVMSTELPSSDQRFGAREVLCSKSDIKATPKYSETNLRPWSLQEESKNLSRELERLGKPQEPMAWANPEVENRWLRREATYELFKALVGCVRPEEDISRSDPCNV